MRGLMKFCIFLFILYAVYSARQWWVMFDIRRHSLDFVTGAIAELADSGWKADVFKKYADPGTAGAKGEDAAFANYRRLGKLTQAPDCSVKDYSSYQYPDNPAKYVAATYVCTAQFENAPATVQLIIIHFQDTSPWRIFSLTLLSDYLSAPPATPAPTTPSKRGHS